ncbi:hypothetical protein B6I21_06035 [candidate division KSB1 bacterium 4572_119]|nr:MAG: hypothetical protein B6I21_06035 [candidate division KSB1 bacterium 4572_119]
MSQIKRITKLFRYMLYLLVFMLIMYLLTDLVIMPVYTRHGQEIEVPDLTSEFYEDARDRLKQLGLQIVEQSKRYDTTGEFPIGVVMSQNPLPLSKVKKGRRIYVIVSKGEAKIEMPQLTHRSERNAIFMLEKLGLEPGEITYQHSDIFHEGEISGQSIEPGTEIKPGFAVDLTVSLGLYPDKFVVPDLIGRNLKDARKIILQSGLTLGHVSFQLELDLLPETVIYQTPEASLEVVQGDTIHLLVSKLPEEKKEEIQ